MKPIPTHEKILAVGNKRGPNATFSLIFLGLGCPWVGEFVGFILIFTCFPTQQSQTPQYTTVSVVPVFAVPLLVETPIMVDTTARDHGAFVGRGLIKYPGSAMTAQVLAGSGRRGTRGYQTRAGSAKAWACESLRQARVNKWLLPSKCENARQGALLASVYSAHGKKRSVHRKKKNSALTRFGALNTM